MRNINDRCRRDLLLAVVFLMLTVPGFAANLTVSPTNPRQLSNSTLQFTATLNKKDVSGKVQWRSSSQSVATIAAGGLATLVGPGTTTITAAHGAVRASTTLIVTVAAAPLFSAQPLDANVSAVINSSGGVKVQLLDNLGGPLASQNITISIGTNPPGTGTLSGTMTQLTDSTGTATFPDLKIDWLGTGYTLLASAAPSSGPVSGTSAAFNELRVGDACLGPDTPACQGTCADTDLDGLNDAWEAAGGVDLNGDGVITDSPHDLLLTGADPNKPDIFVQYDWMDYGPPGNACAADADCASLGFGHAGETCTGPQLIPGEPATCRYSCNVDADCTARGPSHAGELCQANSCVHTHDPSITAPNALQAVVDRFAAHGINLHLIRGNSQPHSTVLSFHLLNDPNLPENVVSDSCEGGSVASGDAGIGRYAESIYDLKQKSSADKLNIAYHYAVFSHYSGCDITGHCSQCLAALNPNGSPKNVPLPVAGQSGIAEISGNDFIVSLGTHTTDLGFSDSTLIDGGTFMHELGHNLGMHHGGGVEEPCQDQSRCHVGYTCTQTAVGQYCVGADDTNGKPNYLSAMNYRFQFVGIEPAVAVGSSQAISCSSDTDCPSGDFCSATTGPGSCSRLDFSSQTLPTGGNTPGVLDEVNSLNEPAGLGSGTADLTTYVQYDNLNQACIFPAVTAPTDGPLDFNGDGNTTDTAAIADLNGGFDHDCGTVFTRLSGNTDWPELSGLNFTYGFQCTPFGGAGGDIAKRGNSNITAPFRSYTGGELSPRMAMESHVLFPPFSAKIKIGPGCTTANIAAGHGGTVQVALIGEKSFDISQVEASSLKFAGVSPASTAKEDENADGIPDLILTFDTAKMKLSPNATIGHLSGWLKNSQGFSGEAQIRVVSTPTEQNSACPMTTK